MNDRDRLHQLHDLLDRLERMPASADRDWVLAQARARAVDVETGTPLTPMQARPPDETEAERAAERSARAARLRAHASRTRSPRASRARIVQPAARIPPGPVRERRHEEVVDLLEQDGLLCLDDSAA
jgi:hypothetical protein